ncbi:MAG: MotA/TolQ/ExbB proton channel family protein [Chlamydiota bacterium]
MGNFFQAFAQADFFGKLIFFALFALSLICWSFLIYKIWLMGHVRRQAKYFKRAIERNKDSLLNLDISLPKQSKLGTFPYPYFTLYSALKKKAVELLDKNNYFSLTPQEKNPQRNYLSRTDVEMLDAHLQATMTKQREKLEHNLFILSTTEKLAPFLGLLGTVWGILVTFGELQLNRGSSSNAVILGGLSTALTTTVLGLLIAIPALIAFNYIKNLNRRFAIDMRDFSHFLLSTVELQYRKVDIQ